VIITTSATWMNMDVVRASTFRRFAEISVVGAPPISAKPRDVYLYVQKFNMPPVVKRGDGPPPNPDNLFGAGNFSVAATGHRPPTGDVEEIAAMVPTWTVHGYIDSGKKLTLDDNSKVPILTPQTAFGYFVLHEGDLYGWETRLYGAEKLAPDFYVVRVPNNGSVHVETAIQAREKVDEQPLPAEPKGGDAGGKGCLAQLLGMFKK
jgi:hypothetical protein